jgi:hypothetical protein
MKRLSAIFVILIGFLLVFPACSYKLSLNGASIPPNMKTVKVEFFENNSQLVVNTLSQQFTEALKSRIRNTTSLGVVRGDADAVFSGAITDYTIAPVSVQATNNNVPPIAGASRLTITVRVKYVNDLDKNYSFDETFSKYKDFTGDIASHEQALIADINKQLTEDIFNKAFASF